MLKRSASRNQRSKGVKVKLAIRMFLVLAVGVWVVYQLRLFLNHKVASENGGHREEEAWPQQVKLGRKGLIMVDSEASKSDKKEESNAGAKEEGKGEENNGAEQEGEEDDDMEQIEDLVDDGIHKGGDDEDEGLDMEPLEDPLEENDSLNDANDNDDNADSMKNKAEDDTSLRRLSKDSTKRR